MSMQLPGLDPFEPELASRLWDAVEAKGEGYVPRTHHTRDDSRPRYVNRLIFETSPYLLQHAHNPVNWRPWGQVAFDEAKTRGVPVLLSVGYSTCHWCHVMEAESFEDEEIAAFINEHFVAIKVDREERPDVDAVYMTVVQLMTGGGGWPMTVVMLPDGRPYFGGTYFPPRDGDRGARIGLLSVLRRLSDAYHQDRERVLQSARQLSSALQEAARRQPPEKMPTDAALIEACLWLARRFDPEHGGFGRAPKFPRPSTHELLLRYHRRAKDPLARHIVEHSLRKMANGGIYDHVGDGFARYSTDAEWLVPHFEKMLYDNAQLMELAVETYQVSGDARFAEVARRVAGYVLREMTSEGGGFFSATDADSEGEEGKFFVWSLEELESVLDEEELELLQAGFGVTEEGNFEGSNILHREQTWPELARRLGLSVDQTRARWETARHKLYEVRAQRVPPLLDDKIIAEWNGQMLGALARAGFVLNEPELVDAAARAGDFVWERLWTGERLRRTHRAGTSKHAGVLEDYAFVAKGYLDLFEATGRWLWLERAQTLMLVLEDGFWDGEMGGYYATAQDAEALLVRDKPVYDGAQPSGNSVAALNLLRLHLLTGDESARDRAERTLLFTGKALMDGALENPKMAQALDFYLDEPLEVVLVEGEDDPEPLLNAMRAHFVPNRAFVRVRPGDPERLTERVELARDKVAIDGRTTAYVCRQRVCDRPTHDPKVFSKQLEQVRPIADPPPLRTRR